LTSVGSAVIDTSRVAGTLIATSLTPVTTPVAPAVADLNLERDDQQGTGRVVAAGYFRAEQTLRPCLVCSCRQAHAPGRDPGGGGADRAGRSSPSRSAAACDPPMASGQR